MIKMKNKLEQFKRDLRSRAFYESMLNECDLKLEEIEVKLQGVSSPKMDQALSKNKSFHKQNVLEWIMDEEKILEEKNDYLKRIVAIDEKLSLLEEVDRTLIIDLYVKNKRHENVADDYHMNRQNMYKKIEKMLSKIL